MVKPSLLGDSVYRRRRLTPHILMLLHKIINKNCIKVSYSRVQHEENVQYNEGPQQAAPSEIPTSQETHPSFPHL